MFAILIAACASACRMTAERVALLDQSPRPAATNIALILAEVLPLRSYRDNWPHEKCHSVDARLGVLREAADEFTDWCSAKHRRDTVDRLGASMTDQRLSCPELAALCVAGNRAAPRLLARLCPNTRCAMAEYTQRRRRRCNAYDENRDPDCGQMQGRYDASAHARPNCSCPQTAVASTAPLRFVNCGPPRMFEQPSPLCSCHACIKTVTIQNISCKFASSVQAIGAGLDTFAPRRQPLNITANLQLHCPAALAVCKSDRCFDNVVRAACPGTCAPNAAVCAAALKSREYVWLQRNFSGV
jgi:hypothetical protein